MTLSKFVYKIANNKYTYQFKQFFRTRYCTWVVKSQCAKVGENLKVNFKSSVSNNTAIGNNVNFNGLTVSGGGAVEIGDWFHCGKNCNIITHVHNYDSGEAIPYDSTFYNKNVTIGQCVWLGEGVNILGGVTIGEGAIIQAYSTVVSDVQAGAIAGGHPAKVFKYRNMEHYNRLKQQGKFH